MSPQSTTDQPLLLKLGSTDITTSQQARDRRDALLLSTRETVGAVFSKEEADKIADQMRDIKTFLTTIEAARKIVKGPVIDLAKAIDNVASHLTSELEEVYAQHGHYLGTWQKAEQEKARKREQEARDEAHRLIVAGAGEEQVKEVLVAVPERQKAANTMVRTVYNYEVDDIAALYAAHPMLVKLTPNDGMIKGFLAIKKEGDVVPGIRWFKSAAAHVR